MTDQEDVWRPTLLYFPLNDVQCFQVYLVQSGGQNVERAILCAERHMPLSHTQKNQDSIDRELVRIRQTSSTSVMTLHCSFFFFSFRLIKSQMIYLMPSVDSWQAERGGRTESTRGLERNSERESRANLRIRMFFSDLSSHKLGPAFCW